MEMVFNFAESAHLGGDPQAVGEKLHAIRKQRGRLLPADVVEEAATSTSILHRYFEWNNRKAAQKWRLEQARTLIASIVTVEVDGQETRTVRSFVRMADSFEPLEVVMSDAAMRERALHEVQTSIGYLKEKLKAFEEFADVLEALNQVEQVASRHFVKQSRKASRVVAHAR